MGSGSNTGNLVMDRSWIELSLVFGRDLVSWKVEVHKISHDVGALATRRRLISAGSVVIITFLSAALSSTFTSSSIHHHSFIFDSPVRLTHFDLFIHPSVSLQSSRYRGCLTVYKHPSNSRYGSVATRKTTSLTKEEYKSVWQNFIY